MNKYDDIINYDYQMKHPRMSKLERSAEFAPFAALTGHKESIMETARITDNKIIIDDGIKEIINHKIRIILDNIKVKPLITITYFVPDLKKNGGKYITETNKVKKIDLDKKIIVMDNLNKIFFDNILDIESEFLNFDNLFIEN